MKRYIVYVLLMLVPLTLTAEYKQSVQGQTVIETKEAIPVGFYDISHYASMVARRLEAMCEMKRMGADYTAVPISLSDEATLNLARDLSLGVKIEYNADMTQVISAFGNHPQAFAHIPGDDVDLKFTTPESYALVDAQYRKARPGWLTFASNAMVKNVTRFGGISDKIGQQSYPIPSEGVAASSYHFRLASDAFRAKNTPFVAHVQTSKWYGSRYPTPAEVTTMSWTAIVWGANEILYYAFYDYGPDRTANTNLMTQPLIRTAVKDFITKLRQYEPYFLKGTRVVTQQSNGVSASWSHAALKQKLDIAVNFSTKTVTFKESQIP